ncbi:TRAP transporter substrate-binding protein [uncultured Agrococcus sp.]|uniref:TRAP transporter substrate-binding protein n=1 Tax=uncultured Agrococcus sp. TaxID=382258 RepID=UPI0025DEC33C|nr:TRAP transporter substrate-binding protein [uncultured Agrococcus sp.]
MRRKLAVGLSLGLVASLGLTACSADGGGDGDSITIQFGNVISPGDTQNVAYEMFAELVNERSDGRITVEIYPDSQLGGENEMIEAVQAGQIQMTAPSVGVLANFDDSLTVFDFPFIFEDAETAYQVLDSELGDDILAGLEGSGLQALGWGENGFRNLAMTSGSVTSPSEMQGVKLRTMEVPLHIAFWESIGAAPTPMAFPEVYTALQQGVVDGVENPYELLHSANFTEPANYLTELRWIYDPEIILISESFLSGLSEEDQQIILDASDEMIEYLRELKVGVSDEIREEIEAAGGTITDLTDAERQEWIDAAIPFYEQYADSVDTETLIALLEAAGNDTYLDVIQ